MSNGRMRILTMLQEGKINAEEAEKLLAALEGGNEATAQNARKMPKYFRIQVENPAGSENVNIRIPLQVLRAGMKLTSIIPAAAQRTIGAKLKEHNVPFDLENFKPEQLDDLITALADFSVDVDEGKQGEKVRIFCE